MTNTTDTTKTLAWNALVTAYREDLAAYKAAFDVVDDDDTSTQDVLHARMKPMFDAVQAFPVQTAEQFLQKAVLLDADYWDGEESFSALGRDARRIARV